MFTDISNAGRRNDQTASRAVAAPGTQPDLMDMVPPRREIPAFGYASGSSSNIAQRPPSSSRPYSAKPNLQGSNHAPPRPGSSTLSDSHPESAGLASTGSGTFGNRYINGPRSKFQLETPPLTALRASAVNGHPPSSSAGATFTEEMENLHHFAVQPNTQRQQDLDNFLVRVIHDESFKQLCVDLENSAVRIGLK